MAGGWSRDGAVDEQIEASTAEAIERARANMRANVAAGPAATDCDECGEPIPERRREAVPGVRLCVDCAAGRDASAAHSAWVAGHWRTKHHRW